jgi:hypothetical protein
MTCNAGAICAVDGCQGDCGDQDDYEHFPWNYTEYGVLCVCGDAMDANEQCLSKVR